METTLIVLLSSALMSMLNEMRRLVNVHANLASSSTLELMDVLARNARILTLSEVPTENALANLDSLLSERILSANPLVALIPMQSRILKPETASNANLALEPTKAVLSVSPLFVRMLTWLETIKEFVSALMATSNTEPISTAFKRLAQIQTL
jgi:hypothetical protein